MMDTLVGTDGYSFWKAGDRWLTHRCNCKSELLKTVVWYAAYNNTRLQTIPGAEAGLVNFVYEAIYLLIQ